MYKIRLPLLVMLLVVLSLQWGLSIGVVASQITELYYPMEYSLLSATEYSSGSLTDLHANDDRYMAFRSYASQLSAQTLYVHQESTIINNSGYSLLKLEETDSYGTDLTASLNTIGRQLWGKFVYPLHGVTSIPSSVWTFHYRTWFSEAPENVSTSSPTISLTGNWDDPNGVYVSDDFYGSASTPNAFQQFGNYNFNLPSTAIITKVEVGFEAYTSEDECLGITLSEGNVSSWAPEYVSPVLENIDTDVVTWIDFSNVTDWTPSKLSNGMFFTRVKAVKVGVSMGSVFVDWLPVRVTYISDPPSAHASVDIIIRKSDGSIRQAMASDVAKSGILSTTPQTLLGTYSWLSYTSVNETDYLEIDYYLDVDRPLEGGIAYLRIDDAALTPTDQTKIAGIMFPSEFTMEVEFSGASNTNNWSQLIWTFESSISIDNVLVSLQLYNYTQSSFSMDGDGHIEFVSNIISETDEMKSQLINGNPLDFRDSLGNWKIKVQGVKNATSEFYFFVDLVEFEVESNEVPASPSWLPFILLIGIGAIGVVLGIGLKKSRMGAKFAGFDYFDEIIGGGLPVGSSVLITGSSGSGKSTFCQQLLNKYLTEKKGCVYISYENLPKGVRKNMENLGWDISKFEGENSLIFVDGYSSATGKCSKEKYSIQQPFALTELGIATSMALNGIHDHDSKALFLDSTTSLFTNLDASRVIEFLQDCSARIKANDFVFFFTLGKGIIEPYFIKRLEEIVDCIIELDTYEEHEDFMRKMRVKKMKGHSHLENWVNFSIGPRRGIVFEK